MIVCIDGVAAAGKGTLSSIVADSLGFDCLHTGELYRMVAYLALNSDIAICEEEPYCQSQDEYEKLLTIAGQINYVKTVCFEKELRNQTVATYASIVAKIPEVREALIDIQRKFPTHSKKPGVVVEGRDIGSFIFPKAKCKIFLTASTEVRAQRREKDLQSTEYNVVLESIVRRDIRDYQRKACPTIVPWDALLLDTTLLNQQESACIILSFIRSKLQ